MRSLTARSLGNEDTTALEGCRVVLHHLHIHQRRADPVGQPHSITRAYEGVSGWLEDPSKAARGHDYGLCAYDVYVARPYLHDDGPCALSVFNQNFKDEPFFINAHAGPHDLLVQDMEESLSGEVGYEESAGLALSAERPGTQPPIFVAAEGNAVVLHLDDFGTRLTAHDLNRILVSQVIGALHGIVGVVMPVVARVFERSIDAALGRVRVASNRMDFRYDGHICAVLPRG